MWPAASASDASSPSSSTTLQSRMPATTATLHSPERAGIRRAKRRALPVTGVANTAYSAINAVALRQKMDSIGMTIQRLGKLTGCSRTSMHRWVSGQGRVPWDVTKRIATVVGLTPERLGTEPKAFDRGKFAHYLRRRQVSLEKLVNAGRFRPYSYAAIYNWLHGVHRPPAEAIGVLEQGLAVKHGALTDGPLEYVPAFAAEDIERRSEPSPASGDGATPSESPSIRDVLRSRINDRGISWGRFSGMVPGYSASTVLSWLRGTDEPSEQGIAVLQKTLKLQPGTLVKRNRARVYRSIPTLDPVRAEVQPVETAAGPAWLLQSGTGPADPDDGAPPASMTSIGANPTVTLDELILLVFEVLARDVRTPQQWNDTFDYLIPQLVVQLPAWPPGRDLLIDSSDGQQLRSGRGMDPAPVWVYRHQGAYYGVQYGQSVPVRCDGDGFFRALLISMGQAQLVMTERLSLGPDRSEAAVVAAMRGHLAQYVTGHQELVASLLHARSLPAAHCSP